jgi:pimeloyl-ACP methyl ester carboxylesterase
MSDMLWVHGWGTSPNIWANGPEKYLPSLKHHYISYSNCYQADDFLLHLEEMIQRLKRPCWICGWSMGGMLVMEAISKRNSSTIRGAVIVSSSLRFVHKSREYGWSERVLERMISKLRISPDEVLLSFWRQMFSIELSQRAVVEPATDLSIEGLAAGLAYLKRTDITNVWQSVVSNVPILWMHGKQDAIYPHHAVPLLTNDQFCLMEGSGHVPFLTQSQEFYENLRRWMDDHS